MLSGPDQSNDLSILDGDDESALPDSRAIWVGIDCTVGAF